MVWQWHPVRVLAPFVPYCQPERMLLTNAGRVLTHRHLHQGVWGAQNPGPQALRTHMRRLRTKLNDDANNPIYILTEIRVDYHMPPPPAEAAYGRQRNAAHSSLKVVQGRVALVAT